jgi:hypothetical protein
MRSLLDLIKSIDQTPISAEIEVTPVEVNDTCQPIDDTAIKTDSDDVYYVGDQEAEVSKPKRNNVKKYGRTFQR